MRQQPAVTAQHLDPDDPDSVTAAFLGTGAAGLEVLARDAQRLLAEDAVTYHPPGGATAGARWWLDPVPLVLGRDEWRAVAVGVEQRAALLDLVLADLYGPRELVRGGDLPPELVFAHPGFLRPLHRVRLPGRHQLTVTGTDLVRDRTGAWRPVADRTQLPAGAAYALEHRSVLNRLLPDVVRGAAVERLAPYVRALRGALRAAAPPAVAEPRIAVLTPGTGAATAFEHAQIAAALGLPLVEGADLSVRDGHVWLRSLDRAPTRIDVLLRRVDAWWCDPLELRPESRLAPPGLVEAARRGTVSVVNHLGAGVLENPGLHAYLPALARRLLGQELRLPPPRTLWCGDPVHRAEALATLDDLVVRPLAPAGGDEPVHVSRLTAERRAELRARIQRHPHRWVAQEHLEGPTEASVDPEGALVEARVQLRTFTVAHDGGHTTMQGGLARATDAGRLHATRSPSAWSKDAWVLGAADEPAEDFWLQSGPRVRPDLAETVVPARAVENLLWLGRYAERAEATVRLLRALDDRRSEQTAGTPALSEVVDRLLRALSTVTATLPGFLEEADRAAPDDELHQLVTDRDRPGTLAFSVDRLLTAAQAVRDQLSGDTWPVVNTLERHVLGRDGALPLTVDGVRGPAASRAALGPVLTALLALQGLGAESLVRDPTWRFLEAGRRIERALQLVALLRATVTELDDASPPVASLLLESVLATAESLITYRRRYRSRAQLVTVLELLLLDDTNPRALTWQLDRLDELLPAMSLPRGDAHATTPEAALATTRTALATADLEALHGPASARFLSTLDSLLQRAAGELSRRVFLPVPARRPLVEGRAGRTDDTVVA